MRNVSREITELLPTPNTSAGTGVGEHGTGGPNLQTAIALLPTPSVADSMGGHLSRSGDRSGELLLPGVAKALTTPLLPTPTTAPTTGNGHAWNLGGEARLARIGVPTDPPCTDGKPSLHDPLPGQLSLDATGESG